MGQSILEALTQSINNDPQLILHVGPGLLHSATPFLYDTTETVTETTYTATTTTTSVSTPTCYSTASGLSTCSRRKRSVDEDVVEAEEDIAPSSLVKRETEETVDLVASPELRGERLFGLGSIKSVTTLTVSTASTVTETAQAITIQTINFSSGCFPSDLVTDVPECQSSTTTAAT